ncbi:hypothetical protein [Agromyces albus]|uniref:hypothetical protein n=1 Tax=Agromyces albus TaxID=205332 RepID=UPI0013E92EA9|nr:hypothetical protein [Agromyces albus]
MSVVLAALSTAAGTVAGVFLINGAWPVGKGVGFVALFVTVVLLAATAMTWVLTKRR